MDAALCSIRKVNQQQFRILCKRLIFAFPQLDKEIVEHNKQAIQRIKLVLMNFIQCWNDLGENGAPFHDQLRHVHHMIKHIGDTIMQSIRRDKLNVAHDQFGIVFNLACCS